jgi:hypothetical protein
VRYYVQAAPVSDTVSGTTPLWHIIARRLTEKGARRTWWQRVNQPAHDTLFIYRIWDNQEKKVLEP